MPQSRKSAKASASTAGKVQEESSVHEESSSSEQEQDLEIFLQPSQVQVVPNMFMPYIEGLKMDWTVNDGLYHIFLKWHLMCENILECELVILPEKKAMQEGYCLKWWFWNGPVCFMELVQWRANTWHSLGKIWRVLQATIKWIQGYIWLAYKLQARKQVSWWMVKCSTDPGCFG